MTSTLHRRWQKYATSNGADALPWIEKIRSELHEGSVDPFTFSEQTAIPVAFHYLSQPVSSIQSLKALERSAVDAVVCAHASIDLLLRILSRNTLSSKTSLVSRTVLAKIRPEWTRIWNWLSFFLETYPTFSSHDVFPQTPLPSEAYTSAVSVTVVLCYNVHAAEVSEEIPPLLQLLVRLWQRGPVFSEPDYRRIRLAMHSFLITKNTSVLFISMLCSAIKDRGAEAAKLLLTNIGESSKFALETGEYGFLEPDLILFDMLAAESKDTGVAVRPLFSDLLQHNSVEFICGLLYKFSTTVSISSEFATKGSMPLSVLQLLLRHIVCVLVVRGRPYVAITIRHRFFQSAIRYGALLAQAANRFASAEYRARIEKADGMFLSIVMKMRSYSCFYSIVKEAGRQMRHIARRPIYQELLGRSSVHVREAWFTFSNAMENSNRQRAIHDEASYVCAYQDVSLFLCFGIHWS